VCVAFVVVVFVLCFAHRGLGGRGGTIVWCRFDVCSGLLLVESRIGL
jgi:hypothetical protein